MDFSADDWKLLVAVAALVASGISLYLTKVNWLQSNRPIVTAFITEDSSGIGTATFNLVIDKCRDTTCNTSEENDCAP